MIVPVVGEAAWLPAFAALPIWQPPVRPAFVIVPHPDDETLGVGGLILTLRRLGCPVTVVAVTDGENCYAGEDLGQLRPLEQAAALARLGVGPEHIIRLHLPDSGLQDHEASLYTTLQALVPANGHLIAPWEGDFHPDHEVCGKVAVRLAKTKRLPLTAYFFWTWHRGIPNLIADLPLVKLPLQPDLRAAKWQALQCHASQLHHLSGEPILPDHLLEPVRWEAEVFSMAWDPMRTSPAFFEAKYRTDPDPWSFGSASSELARYDLILEVLGERRFRHGIEPACSVGVLTSKLAKCCDRLTAFDVSPTAVSRARERCAGLSNVEVRCSSLSELLSDPSMDLLVLSEIGYYFTTEDWTHIVDDLTAGFAPGCIVVGAHWLGSSPDHIISGDEVHAVLRANANLQLLHEDRRETFRLDLFQVVPA